MPAIQAPFQVVAIEKSTANRLSFSSIAVETDDIQSSYKLRDFALSHKHLYLVQFRQETSVAAIGTTYAPFASSVLTATPFIETIVIRWLLQSMSSMDSMGSPSRFVTGTAGVKTELSNPRRSTHLFRSELNPSLPLTNVASGLAPNLSLVGILLLLTPTLWTVLQYWRHAAFIGHSTKNSLTTGSSDASVQPTASPCHLRKRASRQHWACYARHVSTHPWMPGWQVLDSWLWLWRSPLPRASHLIIASTSSQQDGCELGSITRWVGQDSPRRLDRFPPTSDAPPNSPNLELDLRPIKSDQK